MATKGPEQKKPTARTLGYAFQMALLDPADRRLVEKLMDRLYDSKKP